MTGRTTAGQTEASQTEAGEPPRISIIIPHLNTPELLVRCLQAVAHQQIDHGHAEIIVVDNGSRFPLDRLAKAWPGVQFLSEPTPGPGPARNTGVAAARAPLLAFIDADVTVLPGWLQAGLDALAADPPGPIGGDVRISVENPARLTGVEAFESVFSFRQKAYIRRKHYSVTANLMMARPVFDVAGPFDGIEHPEDRAFGERAHAAGMPTTYVPAMRALHPARRDFDEMRRKWARLSQQAYTTHILNGRSPFLWRARAFAVGVSGLVHMPRMLFSSRINGFGNRMRGLGFLLYLRWSRALDMLDLAGKADSSLSPALNSPALKWNR